MYAGAVAVPLIVGRALKLTPEQVALLISADLFCLRHRHADPGLGVTRWFGIKLPVMMGVTFAAVGPMVAFANAMPGVEGRARDLRRHHRRGRDLDAHRAADQPAAALLSAGGHRHHHHHHRHQPDARGRGLGDGRAGLPGAAHRRAQAGGDGRQGQGQRGRRVGTGHARPDPDGRQPDLWRARQHGHRRLRAGDRPAAGEVHQGLPRQHLGAAGHRRRLRAGHRAGQDELRQGGQGALVRRRHALRLRHAHLRPRA